MHGWGSSDCSVCDAALAASTASPRISRSEAARDNGAPCQVVRVGSPVAAVAETSARHVAVCLIFTACAQQATSIDSVCPRSTPSGLAVGPECFRAALVEVWFCISALNQPSYQALNPASCITLELGGGGSIVMQGCAVNCQSRGEKSQYHDTHTLQVLSSQQPLDRTQRKVREWSSRSGLIALARSGPVLPVPGGEGMPVRLVGVVPSSGCLLSVFSSQRMEPWGYDMQSARQEEQRPKFAWHSRLGHGTILADSAGMLQPGVGGVRDIPRPRQPQKREAG